MSEGGKTVWKSAGLVLLAGGMLLAALACEDSETVAPPDSTITLSANPSQVVLVGGIQVAPVTVLATVRDSIGVPLPGQDVRFTTTSGSLSPVVGTPVSTDKLGNATSLLVNARVGPQITATSGKATANITLTAATGLVAQITLTAETTDLLTCSDTIDVTAKAIDPDGDPVGGVTIFFEIVNTGATAFTGTFTPSISGQTDDTTGEVTRTLDINDGTCATLCEPQGTDCRGRIRATDQGAVIVSNEVEILDQIN
jgi:hypothetical protein